LRDAVAEGPVLLLHLDQAHDDIRRFNDPAGLDGGREACEQRLLDVERASLIAGDLDEDHRPTVGDAEVLGCTDEFVGGVPDGKPSPTRQSLRGVLQEIVDELISNRRSD
jgi:hypothetical protein